MQDLKNKVSVDIFCTVIDNFGDIGVCYRLARELAHHSKKITIYVDQMAALHSIEPSVPADTKQLQLSENIIIKYWKKNNNSYIPSAVVIEAFACNIGDNYTSRFTPETIWINLEYLSAEPWVEGCHCLPSLQNNGINKYFFFPGFTPNTGGLNYESTFLEITKEAARRRLHEKLDFPLLSDKHFVVQIFTYETPKLFPLINSILKVHPEAVFLLPEGRSTNYLLNEKASTYQNIKQNFPNSQWHIFKMLPQAEYSYVIKACDLNIVRGEDSITQAVISGIPFLWHIYQQEENAHLEKLAAFTKLMTQNAPKELENIITSAFSELGVSSSKSNTCTDSIIFDEFMVKYDEIFGLCQKWSKRLIQNNSLGRNLSKFINSCLDKE